VFRSSCVVYTPREANGVAHSLAKQTISCKQNSLWLEDIISHISFLVFREQVSP
jgi:hypothetical protein